jgi:hypothetical protein
MLMETEKRNSTRFKEIGKITSQELCALPGILDDISASGLKVHYAFPVVVDLENEYDMENSFPKIALFRKKCIYLQPNRENRNGHHACSQSY